ncbi:MAG: hypothetical protein ABIG43_02265 [Chloroflexota bacterium]
MGKIIRKSLKDFTKFVVSILGAFMLTVIIPTLVSIFLQREIDLPYIRVYLILLFFILSIVFLYFFLKRWIIKISKNAIHIFPISSDKNPANKILLKIQNDNDENFTNIDVNLAVIFVGQTDYSFMPIRSDQKQFSKGLKETDYTIIGNKCAVIEIAENENGILKLVLDDVMNSDVLLNMQEYQKHQIYRLIIKVIGKLEENGHFSHYYEMVFRHSIDETDKEFIGNNPSRFVSKIEWLNSGKEISPIKDPKVLEEIRKATI